MADHGLYGLGPRSVEAYPFALYCDGAPQLRVDKLLIVCCAKASAERFNKVRDGLRVAKLMYDLALLRVRLTIRRGRHVLVWSLHSCNRAGT